MIKILGLLKSFAYVMLSILGAFFKNGSTKQINGYFRYMDIFWWKIFEIYGQDQNIGSPENFYL